MTRNLFHVTRVVVSVAVALASMPIAAASDGPAPARLEGIVVGTDGHPSAGVGVLLVDDAGRVADRAISESDGLYRFPEVVPGDYGIALELPDGTAAPVLGEATRLDRGELARRDVRLVAAEGGVQLAPGSSPNGLVLWWVGLSPVAKTAVVVGVIGGIWLILDATSSDDDEPEASPVGMGG